LLGAVRHEVKKKKKNCRVPSLVTETRIHLAWSEKKITKILREKICKKVKTNAKKDIRSRECKCSRSQGTRDEEWQGKQRRSADPLYKVSDSDCPPATPLSCSRLAGNQLFKVIYPSTWRRSLAGKIP
jgi:hypothetical protein